MTRRPPRTAGWPPRRTPCARARAALGYAAQLAGALVTWRATRAIDVGHLAGIRQAAGDPRAGAPALETAGLYRLVRHPVYLGWVLIVFGTPALTGTRAVFAVVSTAYLVAAIPLEERALVEAFGAEYEAYRRRVRWRLLPGIW